MESVSRFKLRGSLLVDAEPGLLGLVDGSGANWVKGWYASNEWLPAESLNECGNNHTNADSRCDYDNTFRPVGPSISDPAN